MLRIATDEYRARMQLLKTSGAEAGLAGSGFEPLERPFFLLVRPDRLPVLLVPKLDHEHMKKAHNIPTEDIHTYWEYPAAAGRSWPDRLRAQMGGAREIGVEPTLRQE